MDSESARMSSAAEARYRIDYPNSKPRVIKVVALDAASEHVVKRVAERQWQRATFFTSIKFEGAPTEQAFDQRLSGQTEVLSYVAQDAAVQAADTRLEMDASNAASSRCATMKTGTAISR